MKLKDAYRGGGLARPGAVDAPGGPGRHLNLDKRNRNGQELWYRAVADGDGVGTIFGPNPIALRNWGPTRRTLPSMTPSEPMNRRSNWAMRSRPDLAAKVETFLRAA
jgi:hypothetical protein